MTRYLPSTTTDNRFGSLGSQSVSGPAYNTTGADWWTAAETSLFTQWAAAFNNYNDSFNDPYFDYFYTGQDIQITIDGLDSPGDQIPFYSFAYNIQQQKMPLFGFWSYTYDAVLRGTRYITGAFSIISQSPNTLTQKIAKAADIRSQSTAAQRVANMNGIRGLGDDEALINTFWRKNFDSNLAAGQQHLFSIHPPFNFILTYGLQSTSLVADNPAAGNWKGVNTSGNSVMTNDFNERLIKNPVDPMDTQILIENVELVSKQVEFDSEGNPLLETYTFMAKDEVLLHSAVSNTNVYAPDNSPVGISSTNTNNTINPNLRPKLGSW